MNQVVDILVSQQEKNKPITLPALLTRHASEVMAMDGNENVLKTNRHVLWNKAKVFYKRSIADPALLKNIMMIEFSGEEGADAGALLYEFCEEVMRKVDEEYFEGQEDRRVPKCHWGSAFELEMAGAMVAHSILQGGPGLPCLHPAIYHTMVNGEAQVITALTENELPTAKDIPLNATTYDLLEMIDQVCTVIV